MLTISRRVNESLFIYPDETLPAGMTVEELFESGPIEITIHDAHCNQVKIGIQAPVELLVLREELITESS